MKDIGICIGSLGVWVALWLLPGCKPQPPATPPPPAEAPTAAPQEADATPIFPSGVFQWHYPKDQQGATDEVFVAAAVTAAGDRVLVPLAGEEGRRGLACLPADSQAIERPSPDWVYKTKHEVRMPAAVGGEAALLVDGQPGDAERFLHCVGLADGKRRWRVPVAPEASGRVSVAAGRVFVQDGDRQITCYDFDGTKRWSRPSAAFAPVAAAGAICVVEEPAILTGVDPATGEPRWQLPLGEAIVAPPAAWRDGLYVATSKELTAFDLAQGKPAKRWSRACDGATGELAVSNKWIVLVNSKSELVWLGRSDGTEGGKQPDALAAVAPLLHGDTLLYVAAGQINRLALDQPQAAPARWADLSWLGEPATAMVFHRDCLYLGMKGWGLVRFGNAGR